MKFNLIEINIICPDIPALYFSNAVINKVPSFSQIKDIFKAGKCIFLNLSFIENIGFIKMFKSHNFYRLFLRRVFKYLLIFTFHISMKLRRNLSMGCIHFYIQVWLYCFPLDFLLQVHFKPFLNRKFDQVWFWNDILVGNVANLKNCFSYRLQKVYPWTST